MNKSQSNFLSYCLVMFAMGGVGMGGMVQVKHSVQECVLVGSVNAEQARALHARLEVSTGHLIYYFKILILVRKTKKK